MQHMYGSSNNINDLYSYSTFLTMEAITLNKVNYVRVKISKATEAQLKSHDKNT